MSEKGALASVFRRSVGRSLRWLRALLRGSGGMCADSRQCLKLFDGLRRFSQTLGTPLRPVVAHRGSGFLVSRSRIMRGSNPRQALFTGGDFFIVPALDVRRSGGSNRRCGRRHATLHIDLYS